MYSLGVVRRALAAGGFFALTLLAGCSESTSTGPTQFSKVGSLGAPVQQLTAADIIIPGADGGAFANPIVANESGYATTEFWDNPSDDGANCNSGFYAVGTMNPSCALEAAGSDANQGGYTRYWGDNDGAGGSGNRFAASFMFSGNFAYRLTLQGSYAEETSEIGWFTVSGGVYTFHAAAGFGTKVVGSTILIPALGSGTSWGIYMKHTGHIGQQTCAADTDCSDATGDIHSNQPPIQQFALFTNADESKYLVGVEDNEEETPGIGDDDFQDYLISVEPFGGMFVIGDVEAHSIGDVVNFWGAQWWKNNFMSGPVSNGEPSFKGYANTADFACGGSWSSLPGNSAEPPAALPANVLIIVTSTVLKDGPAISGDIRQILVVHQDGGYGPNPGHAGNGPVTSIVCPLPD